MRNDLKLVSAFRASDYKHVITITFKFDPKNNTVDALYADNLDFPAFRRLVYPVEKARTLRAQLNNSGISDYHIFEARESLSIYLKADEDVMMVFAMINPNKIYECDFMEYSDYASPRKIKKYAKKLQALFDKTSLHGRVVFSANNEGKSVRASAEGSDFIKLFKMTRELGIKLG